MPGLEAEPLTRSGPLPAETPVAVAGFLWQSVPVLFVALALFGIIASLFDEILGVANITAGVGAMTGTLTIKYRSPTPLKTDLTLEARHIGVDGRKVRTVGTIHVGDRLCAECEGIFIIVDQERWQANRPQPPS